MYRIYVEKKPDYAVAAKNLLADIKSALRLEKLVDVRIINRYDADNILPADFSAAIKTVFSDPAVDIVTDKLADTDESDFVFASEYLPGQFDARSDSCEQCIKILTQKDGCRVKTSVVYILRGNLTASQVTAVKDYLINPVESRETGPETPVSFEPEKDNVSDVKTLEGFIGLDDAGLDEFTAEYGLAMDGADKIFCRDYFRDTEKRDPTITELRLIDTYWSDHCRHTTFGTIIDSVEINADYINKTYGDYLKTRRELGLDNKPVTLMDMATIAAKKLKKDGLLNDLDESEEINACSIVIKADINGKTEDWLFMFKNETHNHPTEIEPFGGAATCLGGAIRDPLSGRSYVYQAMRVTGCANPLVPVNDTLAGKLPQRKITVGAAAGYSSYGNQIGLATGHVAEIYHPGYAAKRLETGAVVGAAPKKNVVRKVPQPGDIVVLLGGRTGRDGIGGASGSSKSHTKESLNSCGAEVQKGNPPEERKMQRLFRNPKVARMIKRCNDFGAGGVSVAVGELADGLVIDLDAIPKKYAGLDGTELAISESQERMAVVLEKKDVKAFIREAGKENLEATEIAVVAAEPRLIMKWRGKTVVDISREFLNSNGAEKHASALVSLPITSQIKVYSDSADSWTTLMSNLNVCSQKGLVDRFDSTIGSGTVLMPFGGERGLTPIQAMAAKIPVLKGKTSTCSVVSFGYNPYVSDKSPYHGAMFAVIESLAKNIAAGGEWKKCRLSFQEFFERLGDVPSRWGKPFAALLGAFKAQTELGIPAIGGKDSMSGSFENIDVPPTLISFAFSVTDVKRIISPEFKKAGSKVILIAPDYNENNLPSFKSVRACFDRMEELISSGKALSVWASGFGGVAEAVFKMSLGNKIGFKFNKKLPEELLFYSRYGAFIAEIDGEPESGDDVIGETISEYRIDCEGYSVDINRLQAVWEERLEPVFPCNIKARENTAARIYAYNSPEPASHASYFAKPKVLIPVFPGTNCEYDTAAAFEKAGALTEILVIRNLTIKDLQESVAAFEKAVAGSQIIAVPGGFSAGDEPDGSAKFIAAFFRNPLIKEAVRELMENRDGLMLGICNGFQALVKLGLLPFGKITDISENSPTLTFNLIGRHQSVMTRTRIASNKSPWLSGCDVGDVHTIPISHGEGRFIASAEIIASMAEKGQIATQYINSDGEPTLGIKFNPNTSMEAIEGITSPDGRIFGKMGHSERYGENIFKNVPGNKYQNLFENGVNYFK